MLLITCLYGAHLSPQARSVSVEKAGQKVRIALKRLETLSYACTDAEMLMNLQSSIHDITEMFQEKLPSQDGLLLTATQTQKQALRTKKKYKSISSKLKLGYGSLPNPKRHGRKRMNSKFTNRVGIRASKLRKVCVYLHWVHACG